MPELPDIIVYIESLEPRIVGQRLKAVRLASPFLLRTFDPAIEAVAGKSVAELRRIGKRIVLCLEGNLFLVLHLMIAHAARQEENCWRIDPSHVFFAKTGRAIWMNWKRCRNGETGPFSTANVPYHYDNVKISGVLNKTPFRAPRS